MKRTVKYALGVVLGTAAAPAMAQNFPDVPQTHWAYEAVLQLKNAGILHGYPNGNYLGTRPATRYELAMAVYNAWARLKGITDGLDTRVKALEARPAGGDVTKADLDALAAQLAAMRRDIDAMKGWGDEIASLKRLTSEFQRELAAMGVDVAQLQSGLKDLADRVTALENRKPPVSFSGDVGAYMIAGYGTSGNYGVTVDARPYGVRRRANFNPNAPANQQPGGPLGSGIGNLLEDSSVFHEAAVTMTSTNDSGPKFQTTLVYSNMFGIGGSGIGGGWPDMSFTGTFAPFEDGTRGSFYIGQLEVMFDSAVMGFGFSANAGRMGYKISPYIFQRADVTPYFANDRWDNGEYIVDGANVGFNFSNIEVNAFLARLSSVTNDGGALVNPIVGGNLEGPGFFATRPYGNTWGAGMLFNRMSGVTASVPFSDKGQANLAFLYLASDGGALTPGLGANQGVNGMAVYGGDLTFGFSNFSLSAFYSQSDLLDGSDRRVSKDNNAYGAKLAYDGGRWGLYAGYRYIAPRFGAPGDWGRIGMWWNPTDIQGFMVGGNFDFSDRLSLSASGEFYQGTDKTLNSLLVPNTTYQSLTKDVKIDSIKADLSYKVSNGFNAMLGFENVNWKLPGTNNKPRETWFNVGFGYDMSDKAKFSIMYQVSDYDSKGVAGFGFPTAIGNQGRMRGGMIATQLSIRF